MMERRRLYAAAASSSCSTSSSASLIKLRIDFGILPQVFQEIPKWKIVYQHFYDFARQMYRRRNQTSQEVSSYLLKGGRRDGRKSKLAHNSIAGYWSTFRTLLKEAYQEKLLRENINDFLERLSGRIPRSNSSLDEVKKLAATPCKHEVLRRASLFSCMTGLRISDIQQLRWEHIVKTEDGYVMRIRTERPMRKPLSQSARKLSHFAENGKRDLLAWRGLFCSKKDEILLKVIFHDKEKCPTFRF